MDCAEQALAELKVRMTDEDARAALQATAPKRSVLLSVGYDGLGGSSAQEALHLAMETHLGLPPLKLMRATDARHRHQALAQDESISAAADVMTVTYRSEDADADALMRGINEQLQQQRHSNSSLVRVLAALPLKKASKFNAEGSCTQFTYHYLLPIQWLPQGAEAENWDVGLERGHQKRSSYTAPEAFKKLKEALRSARNLDRQGMDAGHAKSFSGDRFGGLALNQRRCWHNFGDPSLEGAASPSNRMVWRSLDRASALRIIQSPSQRSDGLSSDARKNVVVELRGDAFITQQVRRVIGSAVAMAHGWLPADFFDMALRPDLLIETPLAPPGRTYMAGARFHFQELYQDFQMFHNSSIAWTSELRHRMLKRSNESMHEEEQWLHELRDVVAPRIRSQLQQIKADDATRAALATATAAEVADVPHAADVTVAAPTLFEPTLSLLRGIAAAGQWPATSEARKSVIRESSLSDLSDNPAQLQYSGGSFTVVNENLVRGRAGSGGKVDSIPLPKANSLFPELAAAVFHLEQQLNASLKLHRPPSSHCAVNRNAEFTPHVDSGRGAGQTQSMIVGLGNYNHESGGQVTVEGIPHDVRYKPLEFDGWRKRHWTEPFFGERFTLVWFTPEGYLPYDLGVNDEGILGAH